MARFCKVIYRTTLVVIMMLTHKMCLQGQRSQTADVNSQFVDISPEMI